MVLAAADADWAAVAVPPAPGDDACRDGDAASVAHPSSPDTPDGHGDCAAEAVELPVPVADRALASCWDASSHSPHAAPVPASDDDSCTAAVAHSSYSAVPAADTEPDAVADIPAAAVPAAADDGWPQVAADRAVLPAAVAAARNSLGSCSSSVLHLHPKKKTNIAEIDNQTRIPGNVTQFQGDATGQKSLD